MNRKKPPQEYIQRTGPWDRQRIRLERYERGLIHRAERAGEETTIVKVEDLRWLWELAKKAPGPRHREPMGLFEEMEQNEQLGKALATAWVQIAKGVPKAEAMATMYDTITLKLKLAESTAQRRMDNRKVKQIARGLISADVGDTEQREFWSQFPGLKKAGRVAICREIMKRFRSR